MRMNDALLVACLIGAFVLFDTSAAFAQPCTGTADSADQSTQGNPRFQAVTRQGNRPSGTRTWVEAWIEGLSAQCLSGELSMGGTCNNLTTGNTSVTVGGGGCGPWNGRSNHDFNPGQWVVIQHRRLTSLTAGTCATDCSVFGVDWYWNGFECTNAASPIVLSTRRGNGNYRFTSAAEGVLFDIDGDGDLDRVAWTEPQSGVAFLARDTDGDGAISSGKELFGNFTIPGVNNGFEALSVLAQQSNGGAVRGSVTSEDPLFAELLLWVDSNHNGVSEPSELQPASGEYSAIGVGYHVTERKDRHGNIFLYQGWAHSRTAPGHNPATSAANDAVRRRIIWDVFLTREQ